ncbi:MAG: HAD family hydrolase [Clostridia bacterium]|jgi:Cof subfamily protein (haloacid dehalogenase superfamily)|nr:HAD family hydrolase [Clostridia bacterium]
MIKLIATDLDGTFLRSDKTFDTDIFNLIPKLEEKGIHFAVASARQSASIERIFEPVKERIILICENGANVKYRGRTVFVEKMKRETVYKLCDFVNKTDNLTFFLSGLKKAYSNNEKLCKNMSKYFGFVTEFADKVQSIDDDFVKLSVTDTSTDFRRDFSPMESIFANDCNVTLSGKNCIDFVEKGVSKGLAIRKIKQMLGIGFDETAVFGDDFNDEVMFEEAGYSFAMENADEKLKEKAAFITGTNDSDAVIREIKKLCLTR